MSTLRYSDLGVVRRRSTTKQKSYPVTRIPGGTSYRAHQLHTSRQPYHQIFSDLARNERTLIDTEYMVNSERELKDDLEVICTKLQTQRDEFTIHLDEALNQVDEYKDLKADLNLQCAELEKINQQLRIENDGFIINNRSLRETLERYKQETERYEKVLDKIYKRSMQNDDDMAQTFRPNPELQNMASYIDYARASRRLDEIDRKLGKAAREEACLRKEIDALDTTCRRLTDQNEMYRRDLNTVTCCLKSERDAVQQLCAEKKRLVRENEDLRYENMNLQSENLNLRRKVKDYVYVKHVPVPYPKLMPYPTIPCAMAPPPLGGPHEPPPF